MTTSAFPSRTIEVNGERRTVSAETSVAGLLTVLGYPDRGVAVAVNDAVRPRSGWTDPLPDGCRVEILTAVQGG